MNQWAQSMQSNCLILGVQDRNGGDDFRLLDQGRKRGHCRHCDDVKVTDSQ